MKNYNHKAIEKKWQRIWKQKNIYKTDSSNKKKKFFVLDMFPYPSGDGLHVGHPKGYIATDVISRMKRMEGFNVLHPMGFDAFGLPAENYAIKMKINPAVAVKKNISRFKKQLEIIGLDYDWSREVNTTDPKFYKWTQWIFLKLLEKGLAYESFEPINWCPSCKTGLANEDLEDGKCERCGSVVEKKPMRQWVLKITDYADRLLDDLDLKDKNGNPVLDWPESIKESQRNWIGRSEGAEIDFKIILENENLNINESITVFTTRPDTLFGVTYVVVAPEHKIVNKIINNEIQISNRKEIEKYLDEVKNKTEIDRTDIKKEKTGVKINNLFAINPANQEKIPVFISDYVLGNYGTGAVMAVPAHDQRDFEFAKKYKLSKIEVVIPRLVDYKNPHVNGKEIVYREAIIGVVLNPKNNKVLCLKWKKQPWTTFVMGGVENGENPIDSAIREIREETGYKNIRFIKILGEAQSEFFAAHKGVNRVAHTHSILFHLIDEQKDIVKKEEEEIHSVIWEDLDSLNKDNMTHSEMDLILNKIKSDYAFIDNGILTNSGQFSKMESVMAKKKITEFVSGRWVKKYKLRDWVFSRQRYWGEPIPVFHDQNNKVIPVKESELPVTLPKVKEYEPTGTGDSPLANIKNWVLVKKGKEILKRETNTMPQWAGSSWYYLRYMDPKNNKELVSKKAEKYFKNVDLYVGGAEHATRHLIYARFWHKFLYDLGVVSTKEPFTRLQSVGLILAEDGRKMSKRFGNVINPDDIVSLYGADTLRVYEMFMGPFSDAIKWNTESIIGSRRFLDRVWKLQFKISKNQKIQDKNLEVLLNQTIKKVGEDIISIKLNTAISSMMALVSEMEKSQFLKKDYYEKLILILYPFAPHITSEIWLQLGNNKSIVNTPWPKFDSKKIIQDIISLPVQINGKFRGVVDASLSLKEDDILDIVKKDEKIYKWFKDLEIKKVIYVKGKVLNIII